jgi:D-amino-acid dehydrogenase
MSKHVTIIGAGIIGLCSAYYLRKNGHQVTVIDRADAIENASHGNAGMIVPSHFVPLAAPGIFSQGLKWMLDPESPFYVKPRLDMKLMRWAYTMWKHANHKHVSASAPLLRDFNVLSKKLFEEMHSSGDFDFHFEKKGLLMLCKTEASADEEKKVGELARSYGIEADWLDKSGVQKREPNTDVDAIGGLYFPGDAHLTPQEFMSSLIKFLKESGVEFIADEAKGLKSSGNKTIEVVGKTNAYKVDELVIATGAWSAFLLRDLNVNILLQGGKGYSFELSEQTGIQIPTILTEAKVAVTPMNGFTRFAGTMEINGTNMDIHQRRVDGIVKSITKYYPELKPKQTMGEVWRGLRPCSPDGLPYLGRLENKSNVTVATGHAMMGMSLGPATGKIVSDIIDSQKSEFDIAALNVHRFS